MKKGPMRPKYRHKHRETTAVHLIANKIYIIFAKYIKDFTNLYKENVSIFIKLRLFL